LAEAELFGYRKGAFTGAERSSPGYFRCADGGTLFLDEICELPLSVQAKLLRALEQHEVHPLGESRPVRVDLRVVAAAQESLAVAVSNGTFRADLFARLAAVTLRLPPLKQRREDVPFLLESMLSARAVEPFQLDARTVEVLCTYDWPYNVRELSRLADYFTILRRSERILKVRHLPAQLRPQLAQDMEALSSPVAESVADVSAERLGLALRAASGNVKRAAQILGVTRQRIYRMMELQPELDLATLRSRSDQ
jgi:transcriptional regulator with PAS, ATPase and Fis domain